MTSYLKSKHSNPDAALPRAGAPAAGLSAAQQAVAEASFVPNDKQRRAKAVLQAAIAEGKVPKGALGFADAAELARLSKAPLVMQWRATPGFLAWFTDTENFGSRIAYLQDLALEAAEQVLADPDPKSNGAKVALIGKLIGAGPTAPEDKKQLSMEELKSLVLANKHILAPLLGLPPGPAEATLPAYPAKEEPK